MLCDLLFFIFLFLFVFLIFFLLYFLFSLFLFSSLSFLLSSSLSISVSFLSFSFDVVDSEFRESNKCWRFCGEKEAFSYFWQESGLGAVTVELIVKILQKLKLKVPFDQDIPLLDIFPKELKALYYSNKYAPLFIIAKAWNSPNTHQPMKG